MAIIGIAVCMWGNIIDFAGMVTIGFVLIAVGVVIGLLGLMGRN